MNKLKDYFRLFITTFSISATTNGGYSIVGVMKEKFVNKYHYLEEDEMLNLISIGQSVPGPIAINTSIIVGYQIKGIMGALVTMLGTILPPFTIMSIVTIFYEYFSSNIYVIYFMKGMSAGVAGLMLSVTINLFTSTTKAKNLLTYLLIVISFFLVRLTNISIFYILLLCALAGIIKTCLLIKEVKK